MIDNNQANYGGGVFQSGAGGQVTVTNSVIMSNTATNHGGGLYVEGNATLTGSSLNGNTAGWHGGGINVNPGSLLMTGGVVVGNHATQGNGGGVNLNNGGSINGTIFNGNTAGNSGGGLSQWNPGQTSYIYGATFTGNLAKNNGGGAFIHSSFATVLNSSFSVNKVDSGGTGNTFGGGLYAGGGLAGSLLTFSSNEAACSGCGQTSGGGLFITRQDPDPGPSTLLGSSFEYNLAWFGSGISSSTKVQLTLTASNFKNNGDPLHAGYGGGVDAYQLTGDRLLFQNNKVSNAGGGIDASLLTLTNSRLIGNSSGSDRRRGCGPREWHVHRHQPALRRKHLYLWGCPAVA